MRERSERVTIDVLRWSCIAVVGAVAGLAAPTTASAHSQLLEPPSRPTSVPFPGPCGVSEAGPRTVFAPGETIVVRWEQLIPHYEIFRIAFGPNDDAGFDDNVLGMVDDDPEQQLYELSVTLPTCTCVNCTLQLFQGPEGGDGYYSCADIELRAPADDPAPPCPMAAVEEGDSSSSGGSAGGSGASDGGASDSGATADSLPDESDPDADRASSRCSVDPRGPSASSWLLWVLMSCLGRRRARSGAEAGRSFSRPRHGGMRLPC